MIFFHYGTAYATSAARRHLDKTIFNLSVFNVAERRYAVFDTVDRQICILVGLPRHCFQNSARRREKSRAAFFDVIHIRRQRNMRFFQPFGQFLESKNGVGVSFVIVRLVFFRNARPDKHDFCAGHPFFDISCMRLHGRKNVGKRGQKLRKILLYE